MYASRKNVSSQPGHWVVIEPVAKVRTRLSELSAGRDLARRRDERFDMAVSQLGYQDSPAVRLSGIYSLATLAEGV